MSPLLRTPGISLKAIIRLGLIQLIIPSLVFIMITSTSASDRANTPSATNFNNLEPNQQVVLVSTGTYQVFDQPNTGTPYVTGIHAQPRPPQIIGGGPLEVGNFMRLSFVTPVTMAVQNSIAFTRTNPGAFDLIVADFDFRLTPPRGQSVGEGRADGFGFALLNTAVGTYGITGTVAPLFAAEEPYFKNSIGIGFDIYKNDPPPELNNNHISIHFDEVKLKEFDATSAVNLADGRWLHARIIMRPGGGHSDVSVILTPYGGPPITIINQYPVSGFTPYAGRVYFAARSGGESTDHDIDNINVQFLYQSQSAVAFSDTGYQSTEIVGSQPITVTRLGDMSNTASVSYTTMNVTATAGADYTATSGTLTFAAGESSKVITVPIRDDSLNEGDESFLISLGNPTDTVIAGPATARVNIADEERGLWSPVITLPIVPIHMSLMPNGRIIMWDRHNDPQHNMPNWDGDPRLWDLTTNTITPAALLDYDLFCSGHSFLPDGRLFVTGGHIGDNIGEDKARIYDPISDTWGMVPDMNAGRWYPSNVTLANGDVVVMAGTITPTVVNTLTQVWQSSSNSWRTLIAPPGDLSDYPGTYPWNFLAPDSRVFVAGPQRIAHYLDVSGSGTWTKVASNTLPYRDYGSAVAFGNGKIMIVGGTPGDSNNVALEPSASVEIIDLNVDKPSWQPAQSMSTGRRQHNATTLPDGKILVTGGSSLPGFDNVAGAVLHPEMYDPATNIWSPMSPHTRYRGYHSNAMLLLDGRVLITGGGHPDPKGGSEEKNAEIYSPPYLFKGPRPVIQYVPSQITYDRPFLIATSGVISKVTLIRLPSVTHSFNQNQIFRELTFTQTRCGLETRLPANSNVVPPGHYMLFIVNSNGVPSVAKIVQVGSVHQNSLCLLYLPLILKEANLN